MREAKKQKREVGWGGRLHRGRERPSGQQVRDMMRPCQHDVDGTLWNLVGDLPVFGSNLKIVILNARSASSGFACASSAFWSSEKADLSIQKTEKNRKKQNSRNVGPDCAK